MLSFLEEKIKMNGGVFIHQFINDLEELRDFDIIVNCSGVKARKLAKDDRVHPIRGQVTRVGMCITSNILFYLFDIFLI